MPYSVELLFDETSALQVRDVWSSLAELANADHMIRNGIYPHIAMAVIDDVPEMGPLQEGLAVLSRATQPEALEHTGVAWFDSPMPVVYLGFFKSRFLQTIHTGVEALLAGLGLVNHAYYQRDHWHPHCTLAMGLEPGSVQPALLAARSIAWSVPFRALTLGLVAYPPTTLLWSGCLGS